MLVIRAHLKISLNLVALSQVLIAIIVLFGLEAAVAAETAVQIAREGKPLCAIVHAHSASELTRNAAQALADQLSKMTGGKFTVKVGDGASDIVVGTVSEFPALAGDLPRDPKDDQREIYLLRSHQRGLALIGTTELAVEHAVWDLLFRLGYRQFFPGPTWEVVPHSPDLSIAVDAVERPSYHSRGIWYGYGPWDHAKGHYEDWCRKNRARNGIELDTGHIYELIHARYKGVFEKHPELLALVDGKRTSDKFCISNQQLRKLVVDHALDHFAKNPNADSLSVEPSDGLGWCECADCAKLGSPSDRAVMLANEVATAVSAQHPGKWFGMYAYGAHVAPPQIDVHPRLVVSVATAFGSAGMTLDELMAGWKARGATLGMREYFGVHPWDRDVPGGAGGWRSARGSDLAYLTRTIPHFHHHGARFFSAESSDNWGLSGLGYFLAARMMWDVHEATPERVAALRADFLDRAFGRAREPMDRFYRLIDGARQPLLSEDLIGRMYRTLDEARRLASDRGDVRKRLDDLVLYTNYVERWFDYSNATGSARQAEFERLIRFAYRIRGTMMIHTLALYRDVVERDKLIHIPPEAEYHVPEDRNPWKSSAPFTASEIDSAVRDGIARHKLLDFEAVSFSDDLVPAAPLKLPKVKPGQFGLYMRDEVDFYTWVESAPTELSFSVKAGLIYGRLGDAKFTLFPRDELQGKSVASVAIAPNKQPRDVSLRSTIPGLQRLHLSDDGDGTEITWPDGTPLTIRTDSVSPVLLNGRWTMYFYVPRGTNLIGGFADGAGELHDPDGKVVHVFDDSPRYFSIPVTASQDAKLWCFNHGNGRRLLMTVPPYLARSTKELLLPREVVERDVPLQ